MNFIWMYNVSQRIGPIETGLCGLFALSPQTTFRMAQDRLLKVVWKSKGGKMKRSVII